MTSAEGSAAIEAPTTRVLSAIGRRRVAVVALIVVTAIYGSMFGLSKQLLTRQPVADYLGERYLVAGLVLAVIAPRRLRGLRLRTIRVGIGLGLLFALAQYLQFVGLSRSAPTVVAFLVSMFVVFTPLIGALLPGGGVIVSSLAAAAIATGGVATMSLHGWSLGVGELVTLVAALLYSVHLLSLSRWARPDEAFACTFLQVMTMAVVFTGLAFARGLTLPRHGDAFAIAYLGVVAGALALLVLTWAVGHIDSGQVAVLLVAEPVWAALFGALLWHESLGLRTIVGAVMILTAVLLVVARPSTGDSALTVVGG